MCFLWVLGRKTPHAVRDLCQRHIAVFLPGSNTERSFCYRKETFYNKLLRKYSTRMYLNTSISIAPQQTDKAPASNGAIAYPVPLSGQQAFYDQ